MDKCLVRFAFILFFCFLFRFFVFCSWCLVSVLTALTNLDGIDGRSIVDRGDTLHGFDVNRFGYRFVGSFFDCLTIPNITDKEKIMVRKIKREWARMLQESNMRHTKYVGLSTHYPTIPTHYPLPTTTLPTFLCPW